VAKKRYYVLIIIVSALVGGVFVIAAAMDQPYLIPPGNVPSLIGIGFVLASAAVFLAGVADRQRD
jgi:hypothetical protein